MLQLPLTSQGMPNAFLQIKDLYGKVVHQLLAVSLTINYKLQPTIS